MSKTKVVIPKQIVIEKNLSYGALGFYVFTVAVSHNNPVDIRNFDYDDATKWTQELIDAGLLRRFDDTHFSVFIFD